MGRLRGKIFYQSGERPRLVVSNGLMTNNVSDLSIIILRMVLNLQTVYDLNRKAILKKYMTAEGKEVIYENFVTSDVILDWQGQSYFSLQSSHSYYFYQAT